MKKRKKKLSCGEYLALRVAANRDREVDQLFSEIERDIIAKAEKEETVAQQMHS